MQSFIINRQNYEEFFLLYADKELDTNGQAAVEAFVNQNPDLAGELELLQQAILADDSIKFTQKEILYKKENSISLANYEEYFLLSADNELNEQQAAEVEKFVLQHPELQTEFTLLQQTKLQAELIEFAGKKNLYRKEQKTLRIIPFALLRMGAAAAIAGVIYMSFILFTDNKNSKIHSATVSVSKPAKKAEVIHNQAIQKPVKEKPAAVSYAKKEKENNIKNVTVDIRKSKNNIIKHKEEQIAEETIALDKLKNKKKEQIALQERDIVQKNVQKPQTAGVADKKEFNDSKKQDSFTHDTNMAVAVNERNTKEDGSLLTHAVYIETENAEQEKALYIGSAAINKNKLKGFFKKATVFLDKKIRRNDNNDN